MQNHHTQSVLDINDEVLESVLNAVIFNKGQSLQSQEGDFKGVGVFKKYAPKHFEQLAESKDGKLALTIETRDWQMEKGKTPRSGTSTKIHIRSKYLDKDGQLAYGYDLASFPADKELFITILGMLSLALDKI